MENHIGVNFDYWIGDDYWSHPQPVEPWQVCAISVGIEPKGMTADRKDYSIGPYIKPMWDAEQKRAVLLEFERRLTLLTKDLSDPRFFAVRNDGKVFLHEFVAWMKAKGITDFPLELAKLDAKPKDLFEWKNIAATLEEDSINSAEKSSSTHKPPPIPNNLPLADDQKAAVRREMASHAANERHEQPGGYRHKHDQLLAAWATGKYGSRNECAKQECDSVGLSESAARKALRNTPDPSQP